MQTTKIQVILLEAPASIPVESPALTHEELQCGFVPMVGIGMKYGIQSFEHSVSPDGALRAFTKLMARWFVALMFLVFALGIPFFLAATFLDSIAGLLESFAHHIFNAVLYILGACLLVAAAIAAWVFFEARRQK
jgi:hypothetical protein